MRQAYRGRHRDHFTAEQRKLHAVLALRHAIAHGRNAARHLPNRVHGVQRFTDLLGIIFIGLMRGKHIVIGGNDTDIVTQHTFQRGFIFRLAGGETVGQVAAGQFSAMHGFGFRLFDTREVGFAGRF